MKRLLLTTLLTPIISFANTSHTDCAVAGAYINLSTPDQTYRVGQPFTPEITVEFNFPNPSPYDDKYIWTIVQTMDTQRIVQDNEGYNPTGIGYHDKWHYFINSQIKLHPGVQQYNLQIFIPRYGCSIGVSNLVTVI